MTRAALIDADGLVTNLITVGEDYSPPEGFSLWTAEPSPRIGDVLVDGVFVPAEAGIAPPAPVRVTKADFQRLLKASERYEINTRAAEVRALTIEERRSGDPGVILLLALEDVMLAFDRPAEFIELDHPETAQGLGLLAYLDVIEPSRIAEIIGNQPPA